MLHPIVQVSGSVRYPLFQPNMYFFMRLLYKADLLPSGTLPQQQKYMNVPHIQTCSLLSNLNSHPD